ncbi:TIGR00270 family protein [Candidatus Woesearchaeota archaeon]|nr:TIGR00270 family protein [Candidatus Woesearchaeota archaeon]
MLCELCGKNNAVLEALIEGTSMKVCSYCKKFGRVVGRIAEETPKIIPKKSVAQVVQSEFIVSDYGKRIKSVRERLGKTQDEFAQLLSEKVSVLRKMEVGEFEPPLETAKKIERVLKIKLVENDDSSDVELPHGHKKLEGFTIGDIIRFKEKKHA